MNNKRIFGMIAFGVGAVLLIVSMMTNSWFTRSYSKRELAEAARERGPRGPFQPEIPSSGSVAVGLWGTMEIERCLEGQLECEKNSLRPSLAAVKDESEKARLIMGKIAFVLGFISAGLAGIGALLLGIRKKASVVGTLALVSIGLCAIGALMFLIMYKDEGKGLSVGYSVFFFAPAVAGVIAGAIVSFDPMMASTSPGRTPVAAAPSGLPPPPPCAECGQSTRYIAEYDRCYCESCQQYV